MVKILMRLVILGFMKSRTGNFPKRRRRSVSVKVDLLGIDIELVCQFGGPVSVSLIPDSQIS